ncbi:MAG: hypothetical protein PSX80_00900 [bacterium]|nr:hypothetical protein [bacterium]
MNKTTNHEETTAKSRVARMVNALTFALQNFESCDRFRDESRRALQGIHSVWLLGGYLYEAVHLVDDLSTQFGREARFKRLDQFSRNSRPYRELFAEFNLNPAFNMDWGGDTTRKAIASLGNSTLYHTPQALDEGAVYPGIFTLDIHYLQDKADTLVTEEELNGLIRHGLATYAHMFIEAGIEFIGERPQKNFEDPLFPENGFTPKPAARAVGFASGNSKDTFTQSDLAKAEAIGFAAENPLTIDSDDDDWEPHDPERTARILATCDPNEVHCRVPVAFGGDYDPDAWWKNAENT